jgi:hypothetical protein
MGDSRLFLVPVKEKAEKATYAVGARVDKFCAKCQEERGHIVATILPKLVSENYESTLDGQKY